MLAKPRHNACFLLRMVAFLHVDLRTYTQSGAGGLSSVNGRFGNVDPALQEQLEHHDAAIKLSDDRVGTALRYSFDQVKPCAQCASARKHVRRVQNAGSIEMRADGDT